MSRPPLWPDGWEKSSLVSVKDELKKACSRSFKKRPHPLILEQQKKLKKQLDLFD